MFQSFIISSLKILTLILSFCIDSYIIFNYYFYFDIALYINKVFKNFLLL